MMLEDQQKIQYLETGIEDTYFLTKAFLQNEI